MNLPNPKKSLYICLTVCLLCALALSACAHEHSWTAANCVNPKTCKECGATEGIALGHNVTGVSCTTDGSCSRCLAVVAATGHTLTEATCSEAAKCTVCGEYSGEPLGHSDVDGVCQGCGLKTNTVGKGTGDAVISDILVGDGLYRVHFTHDGSKHFAVNSYDKNGNSELLANVMGKYQGADVLRRVGPYSLKITADGNWTYKVEQIKEATEASFSGNIDTVTDLCYATSGFWKITYDGDGYFGVWMYTSEGRKLLVNTEQQFDENVMITVPAGSYVYFDVTADANWTIEKS